VGIYNGTSRWRILLSIAALAVVVATIFYTNYLVRNVAEQERRQMDNYVRAVESISLNQVIAEQNASCDLDFSQQLDIINSIKNPMIVVEEDGSVQYGNNYGDELNDDQAFLQKQLQILQSEGRKPLEVNSLVGTKQYIYYQQSSLLNRLRYYPFVMILLVATFVIIGYLNYRSERNAEQSRIWAGLAKETAHQLGTPISGMVAWLEHLRMMYEEDGELMEIVDELGKDVKRLELVADRFSKIGSTPELTATDVGEVLKRIFKYMERRAPKRLKFEYLQKNNTIVTAMINAPLFEWVLENLLRNALDASGREGEITGEISEDDKYVYINVSDTGKGIPRSKHEAIFKPGYTTKKRGWGLGLSLARRIVETYHRGKIFVAESSEGNGTTFRIQLPKNKPI
jgi:signal transduction histidine kinase